MTIYFDTEDNSKELAATCRSGHEKVCTQIAAIASDGSRFHIRPKVTQVRKVKSGLSIHTWDIIPFTTWLQSFGPGARVYAHNMSYDIGNLWPEALDRFNVTMVGGRMITARWANCTFVDSLNIWPMSLKKLGEAVGLKKLDFDSESEEYLWRDVEIVKAGMDLAETIAGGFGVNVPNTLGGLCVQVWKAMGGVNWHSALEPARLAYYGGRTEIFAPAAKGRILYTDINSLYPSTMMGEFPDADDQFFDLSTLAQARARVLDLAFDCWGVCDVDMEISQSNYVAPLPCRRDDGAVHYPVGTVRGWWTVQEIRAAIRKGARLLEFRDCYGSLSASRPYRDFVRTCYQRRLDTKDPGQSLFWKLLMNNLYGQLGQSGVVTRSVQLKKHLMELDGEKVLTIEGTPYGTKLLTDVNTPLAQHVNWLHAAYVTSYGRLQLLKYLDMIPKDNLIYCDTDSVFFRCEGEAPFPISMELGEMKLEDRVAMMICKQPKVYQVENEAGRVKYKVKGVPAPREAGDPNLQEQFFHTGQASFRMPYKFREAVSYFPQVEQGDITASTRMLSVWRDVSKRMIKEYDKKDLRGGRYFPKTSSLSAASQV